MPNTVQNTQNINNTNTNTTIIPSITSQTAKENGKYPVPNIVNNMHELNNNSINTLSASKLGVLQCTPELFTDIDLTNHNHLTGPYIGGDLYKSYIFGKSLLSRSRSISLAQHRNFSV